MSEAHKSEMITQWIVKAEHDLKILKDEMSTENPATDAVCFHAQQCVEKYLKAYLVYNEIYFRKTHSIEELITTCKKSDPDFSMLIDIKAHELTVYATELRYPDDFYIPTIEETKEALEIVEKAKDFIIKKLKEKGYQGGY